MNVGFCGIFSDSSEKNENFLLVTFFANTSPAVQALSLIVAYDNNANVLLLTPTTINCDSESLIASINVAQLQSSVTLMFIYAIKGRDGVEVKQANENT